MTTEQQAEELTKAYIASYNLAMRQVRNPGFATQIAGMIVVAINGTLPKQKTDANTVMGLGLLAQMIAAGQGSRRRKGQKTKRKSKQGAQR